MAKATPTVEVVKDYDGYFEGLVRGMIDGKKGPFKHTTIVISSGPWRPDAVTYRSSEGKLFLDFYSALRAGFGSLSRKDVEALTELL